MTVERSPSQTILDRIAEREGISPVDIEPPLFEVIDPEALDALFHDERGTREPERRVAFSYAGYDVAVIGDGRVRIEEREKDPSSVDGSATRSTRE